MATLDFMSESRCTSSFFIAGSLSRSGQRDEGFGVVLDEEPLHGGPLDLRVLVAGIQVHERRAGRAGAHEAEVAHGGSPQVQRWVRSSQAR